MSPLYFVLSGWNLIHTVLEIDLFVMSQIVLITCWSAINYDLHKKQLHNMLTAALSKIACKHKTRTILETRLLSRGNLCFKVCPLISLFCQVDLGFLRNITAIGTQGAISKETKKHYFVRTYKVDVSATEEDWITIKEGPKQKVGESCSTAPPAVDGLLRGLASLGQSPDSMSVSKVERL